MTIRLQVLGEPLLEFGRGEFGVDPRLAMRKSGALMAVPDRLETHQLGLVCPAEEVQAIKTWFSVMRGLVMGDEANASRFGAFPGTEKAFGCVYEIPDQFIRTIDQKEFALQQSKNPADKFEGLLDLYGGKIESMFNDVRPRVVLVAFRESEADLRVTNSKLSPEERQALEYLQREDDKQTELFAPDPEELKRIAELKPQAEELLFRNFYRALKARMMQRPNAVPLQVIREHTYREDKASQSGATRAWNLGTSLFYKAGSIPWRPKDLPSNYCFVGVSFHHLKRKAGDVMYASVAQAFSSTVQPFVLRGATIPKDQVEYKQPYLKQAQAADLIDRVIDAYVKNAGTVPDRVVVHKTSRYHAEEADGFNAGLSKAAAIDLVWLGQTGFRLVKKGSQEVWRGTWVDVDGRENYLFTTGYVPWWKEYPGPHIPAPLLFGSHNKTDLKARAEEILTLTKMNWNSSDGLARYPVTISFARRVGMVMTELGDDPSPNPSYRFYM
ncbi:hypothetical protein [Roseateles sp.]|uniref:hypothetical protein n=1 Tax=Roseateles sp. TaxID=1971397 RepID=UPI0039E9A6DB